LTDLLVAFHQAAADFDLDGRTFFGWRVNAFCLFLVKRSEYALKINKLQTPQNLFPSPVND
jgi:hypothetical protein